MKKSEKYFEAIVAVLESEMPTNKKFAVLELLMQEHYVAGIVERAEAEGA